MTSSLLVNLRRDCLSIILLGLGATYPAHGQPAESTQDEPPSAARPVVAATVDDVPIYRAQVDALVNRLAADRELVPAVRRRLQAEALEQLVKREMVLAHLEARGLACSGEQVEVSLSRLRDELARQQKTLADHCRSMGIDEAALRRTVQWQLSWQAYLDKYLTDENLRRYFEDHRTEFDGTRLRVAQILWKYSDDERRRREALRQAGDVRQEIVDGQLTFADAARKYSQSPSAVQGGELGWIARHEPMPEMFNRVAYQLQVGEVSQPLASPLGVHLIRCLEIEAGTRTWQEARDALSAAVIRYLFDWNAERAGGKAKVRYNGTVPHFKPGTKEIVEEPDEPQQSDR